MEDNTSDLPADDFRKVGQTNMDPEEKDVKTFHSSSTSNYSDFQNNKKSGVSKLLIIVLVVVVLALIGGTGFLLRDKFSPKTEPSPSPELQAPTSTETPSPTPQALDRSQFKIRILNGTSTTGLAATVSAKLKGLGYQIDKTGNATNSAFTQTQIRAKDSAVGLIDQLIQDLSPDYQAASASALKSSDAADAEVTIGSK